MDQRHLFTTYLPWVGTAAVVGYAVYLTLRTKCSSKSDPKNECVNRCIDKNSDKIVHSFDIEDMANKSVFCRCWRSKKFPYCDGAHNKHNETQGDNVGPLIIQKKSN